MLKVEVNKTNREWLLNMSVKDFIKMCLSSENVSDDICDKALFDFIDNVEHNIYPNSTISCSMCDHPLSNNAECQDVKAGPPCFEGFQLWLDNNRIEVKDV